METEEKAFWNKDVAKILGIGESTVRKWCLELEKNGYKFIRGFKDSRAFLQHDLTAMTYFKSLVKDSNYTFSQAAEMVVSKYGGEKEQNGITEPVQKENKRSERSLEDMNDNLEKLLEISREQLGIMKEQLEISKNLNEKLLESIQKRDNIIEQQAQKIMIDYAGTDNEAEEERLNINEKSSDYDLQNNFKETVNPKKKGLIKRISNLFKN